MLTQEIVEKSVCPKCGSHGTSAYLEVNIRHGCGSITFHDEQDFYQSPTCVMAELRTSLIRIKELEKDLGDKKYTDEQVTNCVIVAMLIGGIGERDQNMPVAEALARAKSYRTVVDSNAILANTQLARFIVQEVLGLKD